MVLDAVLNFVRGTADAAIASGDSTISVADASIFPDPATDGEFNVVIWNASNFPRPDQDGDAEIVRVTARDTGTNELTVTRAQEMTTAAAHPDGSAIHLSPTAKMFSDIEDTFADFWNADTQELTADVNNTNTTTEALEAEQAKTETLEVTNETLLDAQLSGDQSITGDSDAGYDRLAFEVLEEDTRSEFDTTDHEFSPDKDGYYHVSCYALRKGGSAGDEYRIRLRDSNGQNIIFNQIADSDPIDAIQINGTVWLDSEQSYHVQVRNDDNDDEIGGDPSETRLTIRSAFTAGAGSGN